MRLTLEMQQALDTMLERATEDAAAALHPPRGTTTGEPTRTP